MAILVKNKFLSKIQILNRNLVSGKKWLENRVTNRIKTNIVFYVKTRILYLEIEKIFQKSKVSKL